MPGSACNPREYWVVHVLVRRWIHRPRYRNDLCAVGGVWAANAYDNRRHYGVLQTIQLSSGVAELVFDPDRDTQDDQHASYRPAHHSVVSDVEFGCSAVCFVHGSVQHQCSEADEFYCECLGGS